MTESIKLNERELLDLGMSRANVAAIRNLQRITGGTLTDATELAEVIAITIGTISEMRGHVTRLQAEIEALKMPQQRVKVYTKEFTDIDELIKMNMRKQYIKEPAENAPIRPVSLDGIQRQIDEIKTFLGI